MQRCTGRLRCGQRDRGAARHPAVVDVDVIPARPQQVDHRRIGDIHVGRIAISGTVVGKIVADARVEIHRNGKVYSDIDTPALIIEEGAVFQGNCVMGDKKGNVTNIASKA